jgi:hypothetical protein
VPGLVRSPFFRETRAPVCRLHRISDTMEQATVTISLGDVPMFLHNSGLYRALLQNCHPEGEEEDEIVTLPLDCFKSDLTIVNCTDLRDVLTTARYWMVSALTDEVYDFAASDIVMTSDTLASFTPAFPILVAMRKLRDHPKAVWLAQVARRGNLQLMAYLHRRSHKWSQECYRAAGNGHLDSLRYAHKNGCSLGTGDQCACGAALRNGHLECFKYAHENGCPLVYRIEPRAYERHKDTGSLEYVLDNVLFVNATTDLNLFGNLAVYKSSISCTDKLLQLGWDIAHDPSAYLTALRTGDGDIVSHVIRSGCSLHSNADEQLCNATWRPGLAPRGPVLLKLLLDRGNRVSVSTLAQLASYEQDNQIVRTIVTRRACTTQPTATVAIARMGSTELLQLAFEYGFEPCAEVCTVALKKKDPSMLQCAIEHGCPATAAVAVGLVKAAREGDLALVQHLQQLLCAEAVAAAVLGGNDACVRYLLQQMHHSSSALESDPEVGIGSLDSL